MSDQVTLVELISDELPPLKSSEKITPALATLIRQLAESKAPAAVNLVKICFIYSPF